MAAARKPLKKLGIVLFNLGGPDNLDAVEPFLRNLFSDPAIIRVPGFLRHFIARTIARRRGPYARTIYESIGGGSPIVPQTQAQARALEAALSTGGVTAKAVIAMRYWHPMTEGAVTAMQQFASDHIVLLPLYPQYSTTTTQSSLDAWVKIAARLGLRTSVSGIGCYPANSGFIEANVDLMKRAVDGKALTRPIVLFSAHGLPEKIVRKGDPYPRQVEATAKAIAEAYGGGMPEWKVTYQSRVGPLKWIGPDTDKEIEAAAKAGRSIIVVPLSFVSEHSETLYELDQVYRDLALEKGAADYIRVRTVETHPAFIAGLASLVRERMDAVGMGAEGGKILCGPQESCACRMALRSS